MFQPITCSSHKPNSELYAWNLPLIPFVPGIQLAFCSPFRKPSLLPIGPASYNSVNIPRNWQSSCRSLIVYHPLTRVKTNWAQKSVGFIFIFPVSSTVPGTEKIQPMLIEQNFLNHQLFIKFLLWAQWTLHSTIHSRRVRQRPRKVETPSKYPLKVEEGRKVETSLLSQCQDCMSGLNALPPSKPEVLPRDLSTE